MGLLGKKEEPQPVKPVAPAAGARPGMPGRKGMTTLSPEAVFVGDLQGTDDIQVEGRLEGKVDVKGQFTVAPSGLVKADVRAKRVLISGKVIGNLTGDESVELHATAQLEGNITSPKVIIQEGAQFKGSVDMRTRDSGRPDAPPKQQS
jgi:cytoskeletal protein CcmA (bactofilin family)